jgi:prepilin-type N-terminal cleavage/methylation domain-containing protein
MQNIMDTIINKKTTGFTLIELSIVLVIIGLIIGGILTGQELIHGAGVRATMSQIIKFNTAVNTFSMKYNALPGDFATATSYIYSSTAVNNGNGDGYINTAGIAGPATAGAATAGGVALGATGSNEYSGFWQHLSVVGLIEGSYAGVAANTAMTSAGSTPHFPVTKISANGGVFAYGNSGDGSNYYHLGVSTTAIGGATGNNPIFSPTDAYNFDLKMDDGNPTTGIVAARGGTVTLEAAASSTGNATLGSGTLSSCTYGTTYALSVGYNTAAATSSQLCQLRVRIN